MATSVRNVEAIESKDSVAYKCYVLFLLFLVYTLTALDRNVTSVITEPLRHEFNLTDGQLGLLNGFAYSTSFALAALPLGYLVDRIDRRLLIGSIVGLWSFLTACCGLAQSYNLLLLARFGVGAAESGAAPASLSILTDTFHPRVRSTVVGVYYTGAALGTGLSFLLGGWVLHAYGWRGVFMIAGLPGIVLALLIIFTMREPKRGAFDDFAASERMSVSETFRTVFTNGALLFTLAGVTLASGVHYSLMTWMTSFMSRLHGMPIAHAATLEGIVVGVGMGIGTLASGPLADRVSRGKTARIAIIPAISCVAFFIFGLGFAYLPDGNWAIAAIGLATFAGGGFLGPGWSLMVSLAAPRARGTTLSLAKLAAIFVGAGLVPYITGVLSDWIGGPHSLQPAIALTLLLQLVAALSFIVAGKLAGRERSDFATPLPDVPA